MKNVVPSMIGRVIRALFEKPVTRKYPKAKVSLPEEFRGKHIHDPNICIGCGLCSRDCPSGAIEMVDVGMNKRPVFHLDRCIFCYQCAESCPRNAIVSSKIFEMASTRKGDLVVRPQIEQDRAV